MLRIALNVINTGVFPLLVSVAWGTTNRRRFAINVWINVRLALILILALSVLALLIGIGKPANAIWGTALWIKPARRTYVLRIAQLVTFLSAIAHLALANRIGGPYATAYKDIMNIKESVYSAPITARPVGTFAIIARSAIPDLY